MSPELTIAIAVIVGLFNAVLGFIVYRMNRALDKRELRLEALEGKVHGIELSIAGDLPSKDDTNQIVQRIDKLTETLDFVKNMVTRLDEREKVRHGQV